MSDGTAQLDAMIEALRKLPKLAAAAAPAIAREMEREVQRTIAAGTTAYGEAWQLTKKDHKVPLQHAAQRLKVAAIGTTIFMRITGAEAKHHRGLARGKVERNIVPIKVLPPRMADAIRSTLAKYFQAMAVPE